MLPPPTTTADLTPADAADGPLSHFPFPPEEIITRKSPMPARGCGNGADGIAGGGKPHWSSFSSWSEVAASSSALSLPPCGASGSPEPTLSSTELLLDKLSIASSGPSPMMMRHAASDGLASVGPVSLHMQNSSASARLDKPSPKVELSSSQARSGGRATRGGASSNGNGGGPPSALDTLNVVAMGISPIIPISPATILAQNGKAPQPPVHSVLTQPPPPPPPPQRHSPMPGAPALALAPASSPAPPPPPAEAPADNSLSKSARNALQRELALAKMQRDAALSALSSLQEMWGGADQTPTAEQLLAKQSRMTALEVAADLRVQVDSLRAELAKVRASEEATRGFFRDQLTNLVSVCSDLGELAASDAPPEKLRRDLSAACAQIKSELSQVSPAPPAPSPRARR